ncbi:MAG TPA: GNAT family N-acetyltransferase [Clostridiales bacterium]|nr:MAG: Acetyltransferase (GNAT) family protein [Firmicutes bacterium ADurb.Bin262]HOU10147.1 GNAT family N-acetyltransferase [Clostridiales bacterium]HQH63877.1 GNAT family N-acetyltransferase [Clostridiales bacterium]HQK72817.1 GNAT family N-acetyltransferase [Clostridiales bacterium]
MIRLIENVRDTAPIRGSDNAMCARVDSLFRTYAGAGCFAEFYIQENVGGPSALVASVDKDVTAFCRETADFEELGRFLALRGFRSLLCETRYCGPLGIKADKTGPLLKRRAAFDFKQVPAACRQAGRFELESVFGVLAASGMVRPEQKKQWLADVTAKYIKDAASVFAAFNGGEAFACAMILHTSAAAAVVGAVATLPEYRGRGFAKALVGMASERAADRGRSVYLMCESADLQQFYSGCGFEPYGFWSSAERSCD